SLQLGSSSPRNSAASIASRALYSLPPQAHTTTPSRKTDWVWAIRLTVLYMVPSGRSRANRGLNSRPFKITGNSLPALRLCKLVDERHDRALSLIHARFASRLARALD